MGAQQVPEIVHENQYGTRRHHRDLACFECSRTKQAMTHSCVRCWNGIEGDDFLCGECYLEMIEEMLAKAVG